MKIDVQNPTLKQLFAHTSIFHVPVYQRDYSWDESNWSQLWEDVTTTQGEHFIGSIVTITKPKKNAHASALTTNEIVDGQQRIATLILLFAALRDSLAPTEKKNAIYIQETVIESRAMSGSQDKLKLGVRDQTHFKKVTAKGVKVFTKDDLKFGVVE